MTKLIISKFQICYCKKYVFNILILKMDTQKCLCAGIQLTVMKNSVQITPYSYFTNISRQKLLSDITESSWRARIWNQVIWFQSCLPQTFCLKKRIFCFLWTGRKLLHVGRDAKTEMKMNRMGSWEDRAGRGGIVRKLW